jgi:hypothetical protein
MSPFAQLDKLGIMYGHLPRVLPFTMSLSESQTITSEDDESQKQAAITNRELLQALESSDSFDQLYVVNLLLTCSRSRNCGGLIFVILSIASNQKGS